MIQFFNFLTARKAAGRCLSPTPEFSNALAPKKLSKCQNAKIDWPLTKDSFVQFVGVFGLFCPIERRNWELVVTMCLRAPAYLLSKLAG